MLKPGLLYATESMSIQLQLGLFTRRNFIQRHSAVLRRATFLAIIPNRLLVKAQLITGFSLHTPIHQSPLQRRQT